MLPLTKEQEVELNKLLDAEIPTMVKTLQTHGQQMMAARGPAATPAPAVPAGVQACRTYVPGASHSAG